MLAFAGPDSMSETRQRACGVGDILWPSPWRQILLLVLPLLTWLIQLLNTALYWATMSNGRAWRDLG